MAWRLGVFCRSCGKAIEIDDDYLPGIRGAELAASFYQRNSEPARPWQKALACGNPDCREARTYSAKDLRLYDA